MFVVLFRNCLAIQLLFDNLLCICKDVFKACTQDVNVCSCVHAKSTFQKTASHYNRFIFLKTRSASLYQPWVDCIELQAFENTSIDLVWMKEAEITKNPMADTQTSVIHDTTQTLSTVNENINDAEMKNLLVFGREPFHRLMVSRQSRTFHLQRRVTHWNVSFFTSVLIWG